MNSKQQTLQKINELEQQLEVLKKDLETKYPTIQEAKVGDVLEDGSVVVHKEGSMALLAAPKSTEVRCQWTPEFTVVFDKLKEEGFIPSQWFIPSKEQLNIAYQTCRGHLPNLSYWSSTEVSATCACLQIFYDGNICSVTKACTSCVRAFRVVNF